MTSSKRLEITGSALVFITTTVTDWIPIFMNHNYAQVVTAQLEETMDYFNASIVGYIVMPSHIHILAGLKNYDSISQIVQTYKSITSRKLKSRILNEYPEAFLVNGQFQFWKRRFDDIVIYSEQQFKIKLEYIHNNPVKSGLVDESIKWKYSSAIDWLTDKKGLIKIDKDYSWLELE